MAYCRACGTDLPDGASYCPDCGARQDAPETPRDTSTGEALILVGAVAALLVPAMIVVAMLSFLDAVRSFVGFVPTEMFAPSMFWLVVLAIVGVSLVLFAVSLYARSRIRRGEVAEGSMLAIVAGAILFVLGNPLAGILVLAGGLTARSP